MQQTRKQRLTDQEGMFPMADLSVSSPKRCTKCKAEYPRTPEFFKRNKSCSDGLHTQCKVCTSAQSREYYRENADELNRKTKERYPEIRERTLAYAKGWRERNHETLLIKKKEYYQENREHDLAKSREWREKNPERVKENGREYGKRNRARIKIKQKEWEAANKDRLLIQRRPQKRLNESKRSARKAGLPASFAAEHWRQALEYFKGVCAVCGRPPGLWHTLAMDHWIPLASPDCPGTIPENIIPLCHGDGGCNNSKHSRQPEEWLISRLGKRKAKKILKAIEDYFEWTRRDLLK